MPWSFRMWPSCPVNRRWTSTFPLLRSLSQDLVLEKFLIFSLDCKLPLTQLIIPPWMHLGFRKMILSIFIWTILYFELIQRHLYIRDHNFGQTYDGTFFVLCRWAIGVVAVWITLLCINILFLSIPSRRFTLPRRLQKIRWQITDQDWLLQTERIQVPSGRAWCVWHEPSIPTFMFYHLQESESL